MKHYGDPRTLPGDHTAWKGYRFCNQERILTTDLKRKEKLPLGVLKANSDKPLICINFRMFRQACGEKVLARVVQLGNIQILNLAVYWGP